MRRAAILAVLAALGAAAPARGGVIEVRGNELHFDAGAGESNAVTVRLARDGIHVADAGAPLAFGTGCARSLWSRGEAVCHGEIARALFELRGGDDSLGLPVALPATVLGGDGNDTIFGGVRVVGGAGDDRLLVASDGPGTQARDLEGDSGDDVLQGGAGPDELRGGPGADRLDGGAGPDALDGGTGPDEMRGGAPAWDPGTELGSFALDRVTYADRRPGVQVTLDGRANDGEAHEGDLVADDVEQVEGGAGDDLLVGGSGRTVLLGGPGNDVIDGGAGADRLDGGEGTDAISYAARTAPVQVDLRGGPAGEAGEQDAIAGFEAVIGGQGADRLVGSDAQDVLDGRGGADELTCLGGYDVAITADGDAASPSCEVLTPFAPASFVPRTLLAVRGRVLVPVACPEDAARSCATRAELRRGGRLIGRSSRVIVRPGRQRTVHMTLAVVLPDGFSSARLSLYPLPQRPLAVRIRHVGAGSAPDPPAAGARRR